MKQNGVVFWPGPALVFFLFLFEYLISGPKNYRDFRETGPRASSYEPRGLWCAISLHNVITHDAKILQPFIIKDEEGLQSMITRAIETLQPLITFATDIMRPLVTNETEILRHQHQIKREQNLYSMRSRRMRQREWLRGQQNFCSMRSKVLQNFCSRSSRGLAEFLQYEIKGCCRISAARHQGFLQNFCSVISRGQQNFCSTTPPDQGVF